MPFYQSRWFVGLVAISFLLIFFLLIAGVFRDISLSNDEGLTVYTSIMMMLSIIFGLILLVGGIYLGYRAIKGDQYKILGSGIKKSNKDKYRFVKKKGSKEYEVENVKTGKTLTLVEMYGGLFVDKNNKNDYYSCNKKSCEGKSLSSNSEFVQTKMNDFRDNDKIGYRDIVDTSQTMNLGFP